jgi:hypothetical protein
MRSDISSESTLHLFYDKRGEFLGSVSSFSFSSQLYGFDQSNFEKTTFIQTNGPSSYISIFDSITLDHGNLSSTEHSVTTSTNNGNEYRDVTDQTITTADGHATETITTGTFVDMTNYYRIFEEMRDTNGNLTSWSLTSGTNDSLHAQRISLLESGGNDESNPNFVDKITEDLDSFGNVLVSASSGEFGGFSFSDVTSNRYVIDAKGRILSSTSQFDSGADGTIDSVTQTTFTYDRSGYVSVQDTKQFGGDGEYQSDTLTTFVHDRFGNLLDSESTSYDANGVVTGSGIDEEVYVPRGQAFDRPNAAQRFLDRVRSRRHQNPKG